MPGCPTALSPMHWDPWAGTVASAPCLQNEAPHVSVTLPLRGSPHFVFEPLYGD